MMTDAPKNALLFVSANKWGKSDCTGNSGSPINASTLFKDGGNRRVIDAMAVWNKMSSVTSQIRQ